MTALVRRKRLPEASAGAVDRAMRVLGLCGVRRDKGVRTTIPARTASAPGTCSTVTSPHRHRTGCGSPTSPTSGRGPASSTWRSSLMSSPNGSWPGTPRPPRHTDLVMTPLRMAIWQRDREGRPVVRRGADPSLRRRQPVHVDSASPSTSTSRASNPRSGRSATPTTTP